MTAALDEACSDLEQWLPRAAALIPVQDALPGASSRQAPGSRPPWNNDAAELVFEITAGLADIEAEFRHIVAGTRSDPTAYGFTGRMLGSIIKLGEAVPGDQAHDAAGQLARWVNRIMTMPAIDAAEPDNPIRVRKACPFCRLGDLRMMRRSFRVTCLRLHQCADTKGVHPRGVLEQSRLDAQWRIYWNDGTVT